MTNNYDDLLEYVDEVAAKAPKQKMEQSSSATIDDSNELLSYVDEVAAKAQQPHEMQKHLLAAEREGHLAQAWKTLGESNLPGVKAYAIEAGADIVSPVARMFGQGDYADRMNRFADAVEQVQREKEKGGIVPDVLQRGVRGAGRSLTTMAGAGMVAGPYGAIAAATGQESNRAYTEGRDSGLRGAKLAGHVIAQGLVEGVPAAVMQKVGWGGAETLASGRAAISDGVGKALKRLGISTLQELPEELVTELGHKIVSRVSDTDPDALTKDSLVQMAIDTTTQTLLTAGMAGTPNIVASHQLGKLNKRANAIIDAASSGKTPTRKQWKEWGLDPEQGKTAQSRAEGVQQVAQQLQQQYVAQEPAPEATQQEMPQEATETVYHGTSSEAAKQIKKEGFIPAKSVGMASQPISDFVFVTPDRKTANWYSSQNTRIKSPEVVQAQVTGKLYPVAGKRTEYEAMDSYAREHGLMEPDQTLLDLPRIAASLRQEGYAGIKFTDSVSGKLAYAVIPDALMPKEAAGQLSTEPELAQVQPEVVAEGLEQTVAMPVMPFIEQLKQQAAEALPKPKGFLKEETGAKPLTGQLGEPARLDVIGTGPVEADLSVGISEVDARMQAAKGLKKPGLLEKAKAGLETAKNYVTRAQVNVPKTPEFVVFNATARLMKTVPTLARDDATRIAAAITQPLGPKQFELFGKYTVIQNQLAALEHGQPLRFGFKNKEQVVAYKDKLQKLVDSTPVVKQAMENRTKAVQDIVGAAVNYNLLPETALQNSETYYHQQVSMYQAARNFGVGSALMRRVKKSFQRKRFASPDVESLDANYDYNTDYLQSEIAWMSDSMESIRKEQHLDRIYAEYDQYSAFKAKATELGIPLSKVVHDSETHALFQPRPGNAYYRAYSIPDKIAEQLQKGELESFNLTEDQIHEVLAVGAQRRPAVLPKEIVAELESTLKPTAPHWLDKINREAVSQWKKWILLGPQSFMPYNLRNLTGDIDPILPAAPGIMLYFKRSSQEIWKMLRQPAAPMSASMLEARYYGVTSSGFFTEEIGDVGGIRAFRYLDTNGDQILRAIKRPDEAYMKAVQPLVEAREDLARYAAFLYYKDVLAKGELTHYGASKKPIIDMIREKMGDTAAAAQLARELIGDYGNLSAAGTWLRSRLYPFWSFQEINLTRYPQLIYNSFESAGLREAAGQTASIAKMYAAAATMRIGAMYAGLYAWNNLIIPAIFGGAGDDNLPPYERANPHITIGNTPDGDKMVFRNVGALGDFLEWFGVNEAVAMIPLWRSGQVGATDIAKEMLKSPLEKIVGGLRPDIKGGFEVLTGQSLFPSPFEPRSVERGEAAANVVGLTQEYKWMKGMVLGTGDRPRKNYWLRPLGIATIEPRAAALNEIYDLRSRYLASKGSPESGQFPISEYKVAREAAIKEDYNAFVDWKRQFKKRHPLDAWKRFDKFTKRLDPIASRLDEGDEIAFEHKYLTNEQRLKLRIARDYSQELRTRLLQWWVVSGKDQNKMVK